MNLLKTYVYQVTLKQFIMRLNACVEDLNAMSPTENGRFCLSCNKNIVDLTDKSNEEIHQLYIENNGDLCGIVLPNQLEERKYYHPLKRFAFALMLVFGSALFVFGGNIQPHFDSFRLKVLTEVANVDTAHTIKGFVFANGDAFSGAEVSVIFGDHVYKTRTHADGLFILELPDLKVDEVELIISGEGFEQTYRYVDITTSSIFIGKITLNEKKIDNCVKGKIAPKVIKTAGIVIDPESPIPHTQGVMIQSSGEISSPTGGGIEPPLEDSIFD